jgi:hypothetical protein
VNEPDTNNLNSGLDSGSTLEPPHPPVDQQPGQPTGSQDQHAKGLIPQATAAAEKAAEKGLEKTSEVVGSTIDKVADAAIGALGGRPKKDGEI